MLCQVEDAPCALRWRILRCTGGCGGWRHTCVTSEFVLNVAIVAQHAHTDPFHFSVNESLGFPIAGPCLPLNSNVGMPQI